MKTDIQTTDPLHRSISIELPWELISEELDREYKDLGKKVAIKGFRKGKVPRSVLKQRYGKQVSTDVLGRLIQESYEAALIQNQIQPVALPEVERGEFQEGKAYSFTAKVEVRPSIELTKLDGFDIEVETIELTGERIELELDRLLDSRAVLVPVDGRTEAEKGDTAILDYRATKGGEPLQGGEKSDHEVELGSGSSVPGFEEEIVGLVVGQEKSFELTFPAEGFPELVAGQQIRFEVKVKALKLREKPALDDEFAKDLGEDGVETVADVKAMVERRLREGLESTRDKQARAGLIEQLIEANPFPIPPSLVERQRTMMFQEVQGMLQFQGMNPEQISSRRDKILEDLGPRAEREVATALLLDAVAEKEKFAVADEDVQAHLQQVAERSGENLAQLRALYSDPSRIEELRQNLRREKVVDHLMKQSNMVEKQGNDGESTEDTTGEAQ